MKRSLMNLPVLIFVLLSLLISAVGVTPVYAASSMEIVPLSLPDGWRSGHLSSVWGSNASDVYAVGYGSNGSITVPLLYQYTGSSWGESLLPLPSGWNSGYLYSVWGSGASDVYAVGSGHNGSTFLPLVYHKDGTNWNVSSLPLPTGLSSGYLYRIWGSGASDVYAVGAGYSGNILLPLLYHNNGSGWSEATPAVPDGWTYLNSRGVWGSSAADVYTVGYGNNGNVFLPLLYHKSASAWDASTFSLPDGWRSGYLYSMWGSGVGDIYTVGYGNNGDHATPLLYHNEGTEWTESAPSLPTGWDRGYLYDIWGSGTTDVYAVGSGYDGSKLVPLLYHNDGSGWSEASPSLPIGWSLGYLQGVWGSSAEDIYVVGTGNNGSANMPLLYHSGQGGQDLLAPGDIEDFSATTGTVDGSIDLSWTAPNDDAGIDDSGPVVSYFIKYSTSPITSWNDGILITDGVPLPGAPGSLESMTVSGLVPGTLYYFAIRAQDEQYNLSNQYVVVTAEAKATPLGVGAYDDTHNAWIYSGSWQTYNGTGPYANTLHQSNVPNSFAEIEFDGVQVSMTYLQAPGRGLIDVYIDGTKVDTINASSSVIVWQPTWTSQILSAGTHTVRFVNAGGGWIDLDAVQVHGPAPAGIYDDPHSAWSYSGTWQTYNGAGPYANTLHQSNVTGSFAEVTFSGIKISLTYLKAPGRGLIDVYIDGTKVDTINANGTISWQPVWISQTLSAGTHTVRLVNAGGGWIDLDAVQVHGPAPAGIYDDPHSAWSYSGTWQTYNGTGPYANTLHQSNVADSFAEVIFEGVQVSVTYLQAPGRGLIDVYIDGTKVDTIDANSSGIVWQPTWMSETLAAGVHTIRFVNAGGGWIDLDAIHIYVPVSSGIYDDPHSAWSYSGTWQTYNGTGPYANTLHQSNVAGSFAEVAFSGIKVLVTYLQAPGRGLIDVYIDGTKVDTINANGTISWQPVWISQTLSAGTHTVRLVNAGGGWMDLDAIQISSSLTGVTSGIYDDPHSAWSYSGIWQTYNGTGPYANTLHQSNVADSFAEVIFEGVQVSMTYLQAPGRGLIDVYIDGTKVDTIDANSSGIVWQPTWTSQTLSAGTHTVRFVNAGGGWIDLDAVEIQ